MKKESRKKMTLKQAKDRNRWKKKKKKGNRKRNKEHM